MHQELSSASLSQDSDETEEPVLVEPQELSEDDENFAADEDDRADFDEEEDEFEEEQDDMSLFRTGLHDLNTLTHLYRFGLLSTNRE